MDNNIASPIRPTLAKTPSASTVKDGGSNIASPMMYHGMPLHHMHSVAALGSLEASSIDISNTGQSLVGTAGTDPTVIKRHRVTNAVKHEIFLKDEQKEF